MSILRTMAAGAACCGLLLVPAPPVQPPPPLPPVASAAESPPEAMSSGCRCDVLEKRIEKIERHLGLAGGGRDDAQPSTETTPAALTHPLVMLPGTQVLGHGPYMTKSYKPAVNGRWWSYKRCYGGDTCQMEYYWVPTK